MCTIVRVLEAYAIVASVFSNSFTERILFVGKTTKFRNAYSISKFLSRLGQMLRVIKASIPLLTTTNRTSVITLLCLFNF